MSIAGDGRVFDAFTGAAIGENEYYIIKDRDGNNDHDLYFERGQNAKMFLRLMWEILGGEQAVYGKEKVRITNGEPASKFVYLKNGQYMLESELGEGDVVVKTLEKPRLLMNLTVARQRKVSPFTNEPVSNFFTPSHDVEINLPMAGEADYVNYLNYAMYMVVERLIDVEDYKPTIKNERETLGQILAKDETGLTLLRDVVVELGLLDTINNTDAEFTVFAPTNAALEATLTQLNVDITNLSDAQRALLTTTVLNHVVPRRLSSSQVLEIAASSDPTVQTAGGATLEIVEGDAGVTIGGVPLDLQNLDIADASNGTVHVLNGVITQQ